MLNYLPHGTCSRRDIRCVLLDVRKRLISVGSNGPIGRMCKCPGRDVAAGTGGNVECYSVHAEVRALVRAEEAYTSHRIHYCLCTKAPCRSCVLLLLGSSCQEIMFVTPSNETENRDLWEKAGRKWTQITQEEFENVQS